MSYFSNIESGYKSAPNDWVSLLNCVSEKSEDSAGNNKYHKKSDSDWTAVEENIRKESAVLEGAAGKTLPLSYIHFMMVTQGKYKMSFEGPTHDSSFYGILEVPRFREVVKDDVKFWSDAGDVVRDQNYYQYGVGKDGSLRSRPSVYAGDQVNSVFLVGFIGGDGFIGINPDEISKDGEWEAWYLDWGANGVKRFRSFAELMQNLAHLEAMKAPDAIPYDAATLNSSCAAFLKTAATLD